MVTADRPASYDAVVLYFRAGEQVLRQTLEALARQGVPPRHTVVVDNGSGDGAVAALDRGRVLQTIVLPENRGYAGGMNAGHQALPPGVTHVLFLTHEAELRDDAAGRLLRGAIETRSAVAGPRLLRRRDLSTWSTGGVVLPSGGVRHRTATASGVVDVDWLDGAALLVSEAALAGAAPFDERFFLYWEDVEICLRLAAAGRIVCVPEAEVVQETGLTPPYFASRGRVLLWRRRGGARRLLVALSSELRRGVLELIGRRPADGLSRIVGVLDGLTGRLHVRVAALRTAELRLRAPAAAGSAPRGRILSFSLVLPFDGIPHAGGEYALQHLRALLDAGWHVTLVAPALPANIAALDRLDAHVGAVLVPVGRLDRRFGVGGRLRKARLAHGYRRRVLRSREVRRLVARADRLEFQWTEHASLARALAPSVPSVAVAHDVVTQSLRRFAAASGAPLHLRLLRRLRLRLVVHDEARVLDAVDAVITFSEKDETALHQLGVRSSIAVIPPSLQTEEMIRPRRVVPDRVLMVAAFTRKENVDGLLWLLAEVWPRVKQQRPGAHLHVVGAGPTPQMIRSAERAEDVIVTGYVPDLADEYTAASVVVVPLLVGAGVKFKTATAMLWGVPVVSTPVGAEGVASTADEAVALLAAVTDDPQTFAEAVVRVLEDAESSAAEAKQHAEERFGSVSFRDRIAALYEHLERRADRS